MTLLEEIRQRASRPLPELAREYRQQGKRTAAVLCGFVPPEILHAAGVVPIRIRATGHNETDVGSTYFAQTHCSLVRHLFDMALRGAFAEFDAVLFSTGCDHSRRVYDAWRHANAKPELRLLLPVSSDSTPAAVGALEYELKKLVATFSSHWGVVVEEGKLRTSIGLYNQQRRLLQELSQRRKDPHYEVTGTDMLALYQVLSSIPVEEGNALLEQVLLQTSVGQGKNAGDGVRLFLATSHFEDLNRLGVMEAFGGLVAADLMCTGAGYFHGLVDEDDAPLRSLAQRSLRRLSCAHAADELDRRVAYILESVRDWQCDAVVLDRLSFCAIGAAEFFVLQRRLKAEGVAVLELEGELHGGGEGQLRTRLEAFREQLRNRSEMR